MFPFVHMEQLAQSHISELQDGREWVLYHHPDMCDRKQRRHRDVYMDSPGTTDGGVPVGSVLSVSWRPEDSALTLTCIVKNPVSTSSSHPASVPHSCPGAQLLHLPGNHSIHPTQQLWREGGGRHPGPLQTLRTGLTPLRGWVGQRWMDLHPYGLGNGRRSPPGGRWGGWRDPGRRSLVGLEVAPSG